MIFSPALVIVSLLTAIFVKTFSKFTEIFGGEHPPPNIWIKKKTFSSMAIIFQLEKRLSQSSNKKEKKFSLVAMFLLA